MRSISSSSRFDPAGYDWGPGWTQPLTASSVDLDAVVRAEIVTSSCPLFGLERAWGWQLHTLAVLLMEGPDGLPVYSTVVIVICRQNGKTTLLYFAVPVWLARGYTVTFTLHERQKAREKWEDVATALGAAFPARYKVNRRTGSEQIIDRETGGKFCLVTPDDAGGRSYTADVLVVDEAAHIRTSYLAAAEPALLTKPHAQTVMISSGMTDLSEDMAEARDDAYADLVKPVDERRFAVLEWAAKSDPGHAGVDLADEALWHRCIPTLGLPGGASIENVRDAFRKRSREEFAREYLSIPSGSPTSPPITADLWAESQTDAKFVRDGMVNVVIGVDVNPVQSAASVSVAGLDSDGRTWTALLSNAEGDSWLFDDIIEWSSKTMPMCVVMDARSPASHLAARIERRGHEVVLTGAQTMASHCAAFFTLLSSREDLRVVRDDKLTLAALGAVRRPLADVGWAWDRKPSDRNKTKQTELLDITPLVAGSLAVGQAQQYAAL